MRPRGVTYYLFWASILLLALVLLARDVSGNDAMLPAELGVDFDESGCFEQGLALICPTDDGAIIYCSPEKGDVSYVVWGERGIAGSCEPQPVRDKVQHLPVARE